MTTQEKSRLLGMAIALLVLPPLVPAWAVGAETGAKQYVCPPCDPKHDETVYDHPGVCPICGMRLVEKGRNPVVNAAILVFDGVQIIDYTGPYEVFGQAHFRVFTVSETGKTVTTAMGMSVNPAFSFETSPEPTVLVIPGGDVDATYGNPRVIDWIRARAATAEHVMSVCNGAFILARTGLLDGLSATTFHGLLDEFQEFAPKVRVVRDQRFVDDGKLITSAGLSSGIDAAIHLVEKIQGRGEAQRVALHLEYDWRPESGFARGALADQHMPSLHEPPGAEARMLSTEGDRERWEMRYALKTDMAPSAVLKSLQDQVASQKGWSRAGVEEAAAGTAAVWVRTEGPGVTWRVEAAVAAQKTDDGELVITVRIRREPPRSTSRD